MNPNNDFLPEGYEAPKGNSNYMKLQNGENKFRILSKPIIGWLDWKENKPLRFPMDKKPSAPIDPKRKVKHFWAFIVWNYNENKIQVLEITQSTIQSAITSLSKDPDWGSPFKYDIKVMRSGENMETEYQVNPVPHKKVSEEIQEAYMAQPINLEALFTGDDPFAVTAESAKSDDLPF